MDISFEYIFPTGPSVKRIVKCTESSVVFDGYFRIESDVPTSNQPIHRILHREEGPVLIAITAMKRGEDTSEYWTDEEEGQICLTPTEIIELTYHVLESLSSERYCEVMGQIMQEEKDLRIRNEAAYNARMEKELAEWKENRGS
jgi:hypothetical protein